MKNNWDNYKKYIEYPKSGVLSNSLSVFEDVDVTIFCMAKGTDMSEHTSTRRGLIVVLEGDGVFNLKGEDIIMEPGIMINMDKNAPHSLRAKENTAFLLILFN